MARSVLLQFLLGLFRIFWISMVSVVKIFLPIPEKDVSKETVLVTGAGSGIGRLMAIRFADLGAKVVLWDINNKAIESVAEEIRARKKQVYAYQCDLSSRDEIYRVAEQVKQEVGDVTVLINNAGIVTGKRFNDCPDDLVELTFKVNTVAHFWTLKMFLPSMMANNHGHIITIASSAGHFGVAGLTDYCASKFGAVGIHRALTSELHATKLDGVHTTCVCPFFINTGMFDGVKTRFPRIIPILTPDYAVGKIMDAYHANQSMLMMPRILYLFAFLQICLPSKALEDAATFFGTNRAMDTFKGRQKED